jgi:HD-GYP domain-containing protein (c-di-GMP phosphodiesterase class II)
LAQIERMAQQVIEDGQGAGGPLLTPEEAVSLAIPRGSLTEEEILEIRSHVVHTFQFLTQIPWTKELRRVPEIARSHHEKLDGSGYPHGAMGDAIPVQSRMMTIADIFDALTATDRPYKPAVALPKAHDILGDEAAEGMIDPHLLRTFVDARVYEAVLNDV